MKKLIPPDKKRCQVLTYHPFTLGGNVHQRCPNKPAFIIKETKNGKDGRKGAMSCCTACRIKWEEEIGKKGVNKSWKWQPIK